MDARYFRSDRCAPKFTSARRVLMTTSVLCFALLAICQPAQAQFRTLPPHMRHMVVSSPQPARASQNTVGTDNFVVFASSPQEAATMAQAAEQYRKDLAIYWLGRELPAWPERCPLHIHTAPDRPASGETQYQLTRGSAGAWMMSVSGTTERVLDSVLPHEITHTIFATHFGRLGKYMPRWADEGACTTVEHESEKSKHRGHLTRFLKTGRGLAFNRMFQLKEYPSDIMPLYAQGHSAVQFLIDQSGPLEFVRFIDHGMRTEDWTTALNKVYKYRNIGEFQVSWNRWLAEGSPENLISYSPLLQSGQGAEVVLASNRNDASRVQPASHVAQVAGRTDAGPVNWYQRRLTEVTGDAPPRYDGRPASDGSRAGTYAATRPSQTPRTSVARQAPFQSNGIEILDWGNHPPVRGMSPNSHIAPSGPMVPINR